MDKGEHISKRFWLWLDKKNHCFLRKLWTQFHKLNSKRNVPFSIYTIFEILYLFHQHHYWKRTKWWYLVVQSRKISLDRNRIILNEEIKPLIKYLLMFDKNLQVFQIISPAEKLKIKILKECSKYMDLYLLNVH